jgi:uncharacterized protein (TIGR00369 family)
MLYQSFEMKKERIESLFTRARHIQELRIFLTDASEGRCETTMPIRPELAQQNGFVHAGVIATLADHTAGGAAQTCLADHQTILSIEFKVNFLRPASGETLRCVAKVLKAGRTISVVDSDVFAQNETGEHHVAKAIVTLAVVNESEIR